jgi:hypothetical protein
MLGVVDLFESPDRNEGKADTTLKKCRRRTSAAEKNLGNSKRSIQCVRTDEGMRRSLR